MRSSSGRLGEAEAPTEPAGETLRMRCARDTNLKGWTNDDRMMIACCNDGTRPVIFKIERIDIPKTVEEQEWLAKQDFRNTAEDAYTG